MRNIIIASLIALVMVAASSAFGVGPGKRKYTDGNYTAAARTNIDFTDAMIDGQMKAPQGFFLQGRSPQSLSQMVKLRSNFSRELQHSKAAARAAVK